MVQRIDQGCLSPNLVSNPSNPSDISGLKGVHIGLREMQSEISSKSDSPNKMANMMTTENAQVRVGTEQASIPACHEHEELPQIVFKYQRNPYPCNQGVLKVILICDRKLKLILICENKLRLIAIVTCFL